MAGAETGNRRRVWSTILGAAVGVALGVAVSLATDIPLAPEGGLLLGAVVGWFSGAWLRADS